MESELLVMQAAGMSRLRLARPALLAACCVAALTYTFTLYILPAATRQFKDMREFLRDNYASILLQEEVFNHPVEGMTVFIRAREESGELSGILVHDNRDPEQIITMTAEKGTLTQTATGPRFALRNGVRQERRDGRVSWLNFDSYTLDVSFYAQSALTRERDVSERSMQELWQGGRDVAQDRQWRAEAHRRLSWPLYTIVLSMLSAAMMMSGQFNRRGMWRRLVVTAVMITASLIIYFMVINLAATRPLAIIGLYATMAVLMLLAGWLLWRNRLHTVFRLPARRHMATA